MSWAVIMLLPIQAAVLMLCHTVASVRLRASADVMVCLSTMTVSLVTSTRRKQDVCHGPCKCADLIMPVECVPPVRNSYTYKSYKKQKPCIHVVKYIMC